MLIDSLMSPARKLAFNTGAAGNYDFGPAIDLDVARNNGVFPGNTFEPGFALTITTAATSGGAATANFQLLTDDNAAMSSPVVLAEFGVKALADLALGKQYYLLMPDSNLFERYIRFRQVTGVAAFTAGAASLEFVANRRNWRAYPSKK